MSDPLHDQLADLAHAAGSASTAALGDATVRRVATRVRRRRAARQVGTGAVAACAVGAVAFGTAQVNGSSGTVPSGPGSASVDPTGSVTEPSTSVTHEPSGSVEAPTAMASESPAAPLWYEYFACGEPVGLTVHTRPDSGGLVLSADDDLSVTLGVAGDAAVTADVPAAPMFALVGEGDVVVGYLYPDEDERVTVDLQAGDTARLDDAVHELGCEDLEIPDEPVAWPLVEATVLDTTADDDGKRTVLVVADPRTVTIPDPLTR